MAYLFIEKVFEFCWSFPVHLKEVPDPLHWPFISASVMVFL